MNFTVIVLPGATADLEAIHESLSVYSEGTADRTCDLIERAVLGLTEFPRRFAVARESKGSSIEIRQMIVGNYRVLYHIIGDKVRVMRIIHASRGTLRPMDLM